MKKAIATIFALLLLAGESKAIGSSSSEIEVRKIDMKKYNTICFDSLVNNIACFKLENKVFETGINMISHKDYLYFMGATISGRSIAIYNNSGKFIKELTFSDALLVNSMCVVPQLGELWVMSRLKIINKFKLDGTPVKKISLPFPCANIIPVNQQDYLIYSGGACHERGSIEKHFMALTDFKSVKKLFIPQFGKEEWPYVPYNLFATDEHFKNIFIFPNDIDTIYFYNKEKQDVIPYYALDFHGDFLTKDKYPFSDPEMSEIITKRTYIYAHYSFYQASNRLFFKLKGKREDFCTINLNDHSLSSFDFLFNYFRLGFVNPFIGSDGKNLYVLVREEELAEHYMNIKCTYPEIRKLLPSLSAKGDGWVVLIIEIKKCQGMKVDAVNLENLIL